MTRFTIVTLLFAAACSHPTKVKAPEPVAAAPAAKPAPGAAATKVVSPTVAVDDNLAQQCSLKLGNTQAAPKFDYDTSELAPADRDVLQQIAVWPRDTPRRFGRDVPAATRRSTGAARRNHAWRPRCRGHEREQLDHGSSRRYHARYLS